MQIPRLWPNELKHDDETTRRRGCHLRPPPHWTRLKQTTPSGKMLFECNGCRRESSTPEKRCYPLIVDALLCRECGELLTYVCDDVLRRNGKLSAGEVWQCSGFGTYEGCKRQWFVT